MPVQFIFGNSGSGKSFFLNQKMIEESIRHPDRRYLVIVPEQFTMQTTRSLVLQHPDRGIMNIDVLSFRRLAHRVFEEVGTDRRTVLTETGKNLLLRRVAEEQKEHLKVLGTRMNRIGYVSEVKSILSELMQYEMTEFDLQELSSYVSGRPLLSAKLDDIRVLYHAFLEYERDRFMKPEELLEVLAMAAPRSDMLRNSVLAFDGFAGFTPAQLHVLRELLAVSPLVYLTVTIDAREPFFGEIREHELFAPSRRMIRSVLRLLPDIRTDTAPGSVPDPIVLGKEGPLRSQRGGELWHLEQNLFRKRPKPFAPPKGSARPGGEEISLHVCETPAEEVHFAARTISALVREKGYRYRDIAIITGDLSAYGSYVRRIFPMYGVRAFMDETRHLLLNPCLEFVRGALAMVQQDFSRETVFRFLRTQMAGLTSEETDRLENYVVAAGIRGRSLWEKEWTYRAGLKKEELEACNELRVRFLLTVGDFAKQMQKKGRTVLEYAESLFCLMESCNLQQQLRDREKALEDFPEDASEYRQTYPILIGLLDEMAELLGEETMDCREFSEILDAGLSEARVGIVPPGIDQVQVGDIRRSRLSDVRVLFFLGLNDGWVPARADDGGIVSEQEREILLAGGASLAPSARENSYIQRFYLYQNLTKPGDRLFLSWCKSSGEGKAMRPSYLAEVIARMFPHLSVREELPAGTSLEQVTSRENGILFFLSGLQNIRENVPERSWMELYREYLLDDASRDRVKSLVDAAFLQGETGGLTEKTARALYLEQAPGEMGTMTASVTRLEQFASCAFSHFASYGLLLRERAQYGVKATDLGTLFHQAMELFSRQMQAEGRDWGEYPYEEQARKMDACIREAADRYDDGILHGSARQEYTIRRLQRILRRTLWAMREQMRAGRFRPAGFEISFADTPELDTVHVKIKENGRIRLQGRIDRIDTAQTEECVYVKVLDYKSGRAQFDPVALFYGLQLQLIVYLNAALEMEKKLHPGKQVVPAAVFYYRMQDPVLEWEDGIVQAGETQAQEKMLKKMRPNGILNSDGPVMRFLDGQMDAGAGGGDSLVIPAGLKKDGTPKASSSLATTRQFQLLGEYVTELLQKMGEEILQGFTAARPFADKNGTACDYCPFSDVCGYDRKIPGRCSRREAQLDQAEVWEILENRDRDKGEADGSEMDGGTGEGNPRKGS